MSEVAAIVNSPGRVGVSRQMRDAGAVGMSRAQGFLTSSSREEHLRVGPHQGDGDLAPPKFFFLVLPCMRVPLSWCGVVRSLQFFTTAKRRGASQSEAEGGEGGGK
jgi:hypothetical protein